MNHGFIKLHRKFLEWEWYEDINTKVLFLHLLIKANYQDKNWRGVTIKRGQLITSLENLATETHLSVRQVRTSLDKLVSTCEIDKQTTSRYTLIELKNYNKYQQIDKQATNERQTNDKQMTTTKERKEVKKEKNILTSIIPRGRKEKVLPDFPNVQNMKKPISQKDFDYISKNFPKDVWTDVLEAMENTAGLTKKYVSAKLTLTNWLKRRGWVAQEKVKNMNYSQVTDYMRTADERAKKIAISINKNL